MSISGKIMLICGLVAIVCVIMGIVMFVLLKDIKVNHEVFEFKENGEVRVLADVPVTYAIADIENVEFSIRGGYESYYGKFRIVKSNGKKSRNYMYGTGAYTKDFTFNGSKEEMEKTTEYLMQQLREKGISCECKDIDN